MALKTCTGTTSQPYVHVQVRLSQAATVTATGADVQLVQDFTGLANGTYSISLQATNDLTPNGTYYTVTEFLGTTDNTFNVQVPQTAGPFAMTSILVSPAPSPPATGAIDSTVVHLANPETITGDKDFTGAIRLGGTGYVNNVGLNAINLALSRYACDPTGAVASDTGMAQAIADAIASGATITGPVGNYVFNSKILVSPAGSDIAQGALVPSIVFLPASGRIGDLSFDKSAVTFTASGSFPVGEYLLDMVPLSGGTNQCALLGARIEGLALNCVSRSAGMRIANARRFHISDVTINGAATPAPADNRGTPSGAFQMDLFAGTPSADNTIDSVYVFQPISTKDCFYFAGPDSTVFLHPVALGGSNTRYDFNMVGGCRMFGPHYESGQYGFNIQTGNDWTKIFGADFFGLPTKGAVLLSPGSVQGVPRTNFIGCSFANNPGAAPGEEAGSVIQIGSGLSNVVQCSFLGCDIQANTNTTDWVYVEAQVPSGSRVYFVGCAFIGTPTTNKFNDASGLGAILVRDSQGINPLGVTTPAVSTPKTNTFGCDIFVSFIANAAGTTFTVNGKVLGATPANAQGGFVWPATSVMSYVNAPASWAFIGL